MERDESNNIPQDGMADSLDEDVGSIDTSFPLLAPGLYDMEISDAVVGKKKDDATRDVLTFTLKTTNDAPDVKGQMVNKGFPIYHRIALTPSEDMDVNKIKKNIATVAQRCGLTGTIRSLIDSPKVFVGKVVRVKIGVQKATPEYPASNSVKAFVDVK